MATTSRLPRANRFRRESFDAGDGDTDPELVAGVEAAHQDRAPRADPTLAARIAERMAEVRTLAASDHVVVAVLGPSSAPGLGEMRSHGRPSGQWGAHSGRFLANTWASEFRTPGYSARLSGIRGSARCVSSGRTPRWWSRAQATKKMLHGPMAWSVPVPAANVRAIHHTSTTSRGYTRRPPETTTDPDHEKNKREFVIMRLPEIMNPVPFHPSVITRHTGLAASSP